MKNEKTKKELLILTWVVITQIIIIILLILMKYPLQIEITKTDCPKTICKNVDCDCYIDIEIINKTDIKTREQDKKKLVVDI